MSQKAFAVLLALIVCTVPVVAGELPQILQPDTTTYSKTQISAIRQAIVTLEAILNDANFGSQRLFAADVWQSGDFAAYTAGSLTELGYATKLASHAAWADEVDPGTRHVWVLVCLPIIESTAWIPVEPSPPPGRRQQSLGRVPRSIDAGRDLRFEMPYTAFDQALDLPANLAAVVRIRPRSSAVWVGDRARFLGTGSYDPDGEVVLYMWDFGNGQTEVTTFPSAMHMFDASGEYRLTLTVIDNHGARSSQTLRLWVADTDALEEKPGPGERPSSGGCGCGG